MRDKIVTRIERLGEGKAFSAKDFLDIPSRTTIDVTLAALTRQGAIRRIRRGLYDRPRINPALGGKLSPDIDEAARAIALWKIIPDGAWAVNLLGLSTQAPSKITYLTDGPNREIPHWAAQHLFQARASEGACPTRRQVGAASSRQGQSRQA